MQTTPLSRFNKCVCHLSQTNIIQIQHSTRRSRHRHGRWLERNVSKLVLPKRKVSNEVSMCVLATCSCGGLAPLFRAAARGPQCAYYAPAAHNTMRLSQCSL